MNNALDNNNNNNNGNNLNNLPNIPVEDPGDILVPANQVIKIRRYYGLFNENLNNVGQNEPIVLRRENYPALTNLQWGRLSQMIQSDMASPDDRLETYKLLVTKVLRVMDRVNLTEDQLNTAESAVYQFHEAIGGLDLQENIRQMSEADVNANKQQLRNAARTFEELHLSPDDFTDAVLASRYYFSIASTIDYFMDIDLDDFKPIADYVLLGSSTFLQGGRRRKNRKTRKNRK